MTQDQKTEELAKFIANLAAQPRFSKAGHQEEAVRAALELLQAARKALEPAPERLSEDEIDDIPSDSWTENLPDLPRPVPNCDALDIAFRHFYPSDSARRRESRKARFLEWRRGEGADLPPRANYWQEWPTLLADIHRFKSEMISKGRRNGGRTAMKGKRAKAKQRAEIAKYAHENA